ncbi:MAG TPA: HipA family kinase [Nocardioidaceae bacterium]|nr:HipA family kinase [Nocardioidaceae bacterium]
MLDTVVATAYLTPLREGGSLPGIVEGDDFGTYVAKFHAAGQGPKALVAEIVVGELARRLGLRVPDLVLLELDPVIGRSEPDQEVQELLTTSAGTNLGVDFLPGSLGYEPTAFGVDPEEAATVIWLDALTANIDRSWRNPNLLIWHRKLWCIDHGAALRFHHDWSRADRFATSPFDVSDHVLAGLAPPVSEVAPGLAAQLTDALLDDVLALVPDEWLTPDLHRPDPAAPADASTARAAYRDLLLARVEASPSWLPGGGD